MKRRIKLINHFLLFLSKSFNEYLYFVICLNYLFKVRIKSMMKYASKNGQKTGKSNISLKVQNKLIRLAIVQFYQNLNSPIVLIRGPS